MKIDTGREYSLSNLDDSIKTLSDFGLTPYEAKIYITIVKLGLTTASKIAKVAEIRREEVYRTLPKLENAGLVERVLGRPVKVKALPIEDALSILVNRKEEEARREIRDLTEKREKLLETFQEGILDTQVNEESAHFTLISERDAVSKKIKSLIGRSRNAVDFVDSFENAFRFVLTYSDSLNDAMTRNVDVRIITEHPDRADLIPDALRKHVPENTFTIRYCEDLPSHYVLFDNQQTLITTTAGSTLTESKFLWTDDPSLVGIIQRDFDELFRTSVDWTDLTVSEQDKLMRILKRLRPRDHAVLFYDSQEAKQNTLFAYIESGLKKGEAARYICSEESPSEIRESMKKFGIDVERFERGGALGILHYTDMYIKEGTFSIDEVMDTWSNSYNEVMALGFKGMRVTGEMSCFIEHDLVSELIEYEQALHTVLDIPMTAICAYNSEILSHVENPIDVYSELVKAHGKVLFAGKNNKIGRLEVRAG
ncbi:MAG: MEDS domain-containing protein [Candidatus Thorarchaeota archaeon]